MTTKKLSAKARGLPRKGVKPATGAAKASTRAIAKPSRATRPSSVIMQARVDQAFARTLVEQDAAVLGLEGPSELVREGLRLVHERAREAAMAASYDDFYSGEPAPLPTGVASVDSA